MTLAISTHMEIISPDELEMFGISNYEARAYLALLNQGLSTAREISDISKIPFGRIYDVLASLDSKGLVETQDSRPKKFLARDPKIALEHLLTIKNQELKSLESKAVTHTILLIKSATERIE